MNNSSLSIFFLYGAPLLIFILVMSGLWLYLHHQEKKEELKKVKEAFDLEAKAQVIRSLLRQK